AQRGRMLSVPVAPANPATPSTSGACTPAAARTSSWSTARCISSRIPLLPSFQPCPHALGMRPSTSLIDKVPARNGKVSRERRGCFPPARCASLGGGTHPRRWLFLFSAAQQFLWPSPFGLWYSRAQEVTKDGDRPRTRFTSRQPFPLVGAGLGRDPRRALPAH